MTFQQHSTVLAGDAPGQLTTLYWYTAGPETADTKVHLQAALHADEQPGTMALHHLLPMLRDADAAGRLKARFVVFPSVNPLGLATRVLRKHPRLRKRPSTSELIDWIAVLKASGISNVKLDGKLPFLGALLKKEQDLIALADQLSGGPRYRS